MGRISRLCLLGIFALAIGAGCQGSSGVPNTNPATSPSRPVGATKPPGGPGDAAAIRGVWLLVSGRRNGQDMGPEEVKGKKYEIGDEIAMHMTKTRPLNVEYRLDDSRTPKAIDIIVKDQPSVKGIYELKGDVLTICFAAPGEERPANFMAPADSGHELYRFKKEP